MYKRSNLAMYTPGKKQPSRKGGTEVINIKRLLRLALANWYWYVLALVVSLASATYYTKKVPRTYRATASILIEQEDRANLSNANMLLEGFGLRPGNQNLDNQIYILSSNTLIQETLEELDFGIDCYRKQMRKQVSTYPMYPFRIIEPEHGHLPRGETFLFEGIDKNQYHLVSGKNSALDLDTVLHYGERLLLKDGSFTISTYPDQQEDLLPGDVIYIEFNHLDALVSAYQQRLKVETASQDATIVRLILEGTNKAKDVIFLDKLTEVFLSKNLEKKNHEAKRIIEFIDAQLVDVSDSLMLTENQLQEFRSANRIMDISAQGKQIIDQALVLENEKAQLTLKANYYDYLAEYLASEDNTEVPISPASMEISDPILGRLMQELAGLQAEYFSSGVGDRNPVQAQLELRIRNTKQSLLETLEGIKLANQMAINENSEQIKRINREASRLPEKERQLLGIERKFNLNNVLYTYLLQRRAEAQIQKASNKPDNELIEPAKAEFLAIGPNPMLIMIIALFIGFGIPSLLLVGIDQIYNRVTSDEDIKMISSSPIIGHIPHSKLAYNTVVLSEPNSRIAEAYRSIRARMEFLTKASECPIILVTSSYSGEGKSFCAINMASAYSLSNKRTLLVDFDLRRPTIPKSFELNKKIGLSTYLIGKNKLDEIIRETDYPNLFVIPSGPISPNPGELAVSDKAREIFGLLSKKFDIIIIDSPPIGLVPDAFSFAYFADSSIIVVRNGYSRKKFLDHVLSDMQEGGIKGLGIIVNDIKGRRGVYAAYSYNYESRQDLNMPTTRQLRERVKRIKQTRAS